MSRFLLTTAKHTTKYYVMIHISSISPSDRFWFASASPTPVPSAFLLYRHAGAVSNDADRWRTDTETEPKQYVRVDLIIFINLTVCHDDGRKLQLGDA